MRTKIVSVITALSLTFGLAACGNDRVTDAPVTTVKKQLLNIPSNSNEGNWIYDSLDDDRGAFVYVIGTSQNDNDILHAFYVRCEWTSYANNINVFWYFPNSLAFGPRITVKYGIPGAKEGGALQIWEEGTDNTLVGIWNDNAGAIGVARYIIDNHDNGKLSISYIDSHNNGDSAKFDVTGADVAVQWVLDNCGYIWE